MLGNKETQKKINKNHEDSDIFSPRLSFASMPTAMGQSHLISFNYLTQFHCDDAN